MKKPAGAAQSSPDCSPPRRPLSIGNPESRCESAVPFPPEHRLIITTTKGVYTWDAQGVTQIFRSGSEGIVAATRVTSSSEMLAVADSQVVVLHEIGGGKKSYRLKGSEGPVRLVKYATESKNLFFTTALQNTVQSYSVKHSRLLDPSHEHPSPPSVFAISCNSKFLLSTSTAPPTIHLTNLSLNIAPVLVRPKCSASAVVAVDAHPEQESLFLIAFADGTAALIDAMQFFHQDGSRERRALAAYSGTSGEVAFIKGLHAVGASAGSSSLGEIQALDRYDAGTGAIGVGARPSGITAVAFVPGRKAMAVTAGAEGKCCIVDFTQSTPERAVLLRSWHIRRPATSLSIICYARKPEGSQDVPHKATDEQLDAAFCIAIGREDGRVLLFSLDGTPLGEQVLDAKGAPIVAVEWARIGSSEDSGSRSRKKPGNAVEPRRQRLGNASRSHRHLHQKQQLDISPPSSLLTGVDNESPFDSSTPYRKPGISPVELASEEPAISTIHKLRTGVSRLGDRNSTADPVRHSQRASIDSLDRIPQGTSESTSSAYYAGLTSSCSPPAVPPRPIPRPGGKLSMRQAQTFSAGEPTAWSPYLVSTTSNLNEKRSGVVFDPQTSKTPITSNESISAVKLKDLSLSDVSAPLQPASKETTTASSQTSGSYKTASPQFQSSEASSDTVVDWSTALSRIPAPSLQHLHLVDTGHRPTKEETGSQVRSSPFSTLRGTSNSGSPTSSRTVASIAEEPAMNDTVVDWAAGLRRLPIIISNSKKQIDAVSTATESRQKGHISLSVSSTPRDTSTSVSYRTNEISNPAHQWPVFSFQEPIPAVRVIRASGDLNAQTNAKPKGPIRLSTPSTVSDTATTVSSSSQEPIVDWSSLRNPPNVGDLKRNKPSIKSHPSILMPVLANYTPLSPSPPKVSELLSRSTTPALPKPTSSVVSPTPEIHACACASIIESTLQSSLASLRAELAQQFEAQKTLFEELVRAGQVERVILAEENMLLRADLAKTERSKGEKRSPKAMRSWEEYKTGTPKAKIREV